MSAWSPKGQRCKHRRRGMVEVNLRTFECSTLCTRCGARLGGWQELIQTDDPRTVRSGPIHWRVS